MHGIHVGDCHVAMHLCCHAMSSGSKAGPCSQTLQLNFGRISAPDLFIIFYHCRRSRVGTAIMLSCNPAATPPRHSAQQAQQACMASCVDVLILTILSQYISAPICHWFVTVHLFLTVGRARRLRAKFSHVFDGGWFHWDYLWDYPAHSMWSQVWVPWISRTVAWFAIAIDSWPDMTMSHDL